MSIEISSVLTLIGFELMRVYSHSCRLWLIKNSIPNISTGVLDSEVSLSVMSNRSGSLIQSKYCRLYLWTACG